MQPLTEDLLSFTDLFRSISNRYVFFLLRSLSSLIDFFFTDLIDFILHSTSALQRHNQVGFLLQIYLVIDLPKIKEIVACKFLVLTVAKSPIWL